MKELLGALLVGAGSYWLGAMAAGQFLKNEIAKGFLSLVALFAVIAGSLLILVAGGGSITQM